MPKLNWNEHEVVECLGVLSETEEFFVSHNFRLAKNDLFLEITIWQDESCVALSLSKENVEMPFLTIHFLVRDKIAFFSEKDVGFLKFQDCIIVSGRFYVYQKGESDDYFNKNKFSTELNIELHTYPRIELKFK